MKKCCFLLVFLSLLCLFGAASAYELHDHDYSIRRDREYHWAVCSICGEKTEKEPHYTLCIDDDPQACVACGMKKSEGAVIEHYTHYVTEDSLIYDEDRHYYFCLLCLEITKEEAHYSTCLLPETCAVCHATVEEGANIPFTPHQWRQQWNLTAHMEVCATCGKTQNYEYHYVYCDTENRDYCLGCGQRHGDEIHVWCERHKDEKIGCNADYHFHTCGLCGKTWDQEPHFATCESPDACENCGMKAADGAKYQVYHPWEWRFNETQHWLYCPKCGATKNTADHETDCESAAQADAFCFVCGAWRRADGVTFPKLNHTADPDKYEWNETEHWNACVNCGEKVNLSAHEFQNGACVQCHYAQNGTPVSPPRYRFSELNYTFGTGIKGKLVHDPGTKEDSGVAVRVTFYIEGGIYMATMGEVEPDGAFSIEAVGPIQYITVVALGEDGRYGADELFL